jgi:hypothetical protein
VSQQDGDVDLPARNVELANGIVAGGRCSEERDGGDGGCGWEGGAESFSNRRKRASIFFAHVVLEPSLNVRVTTTRKMSRITYRCAQAVHTCGTLRAHGVFGGGWFPQCLGVSGGSGPVSWRVERAHDGEYGLSKLIHPLLPPPSFLVQQSDRPNPVGAGAFDDGGDNLIGQENVRAHILQVRGTELKTRVLFSPIEQSHL